MNSKKQSVVGSTQKRKAGNHMQESRANRDKFLKHIFAAFAFTQTGSAGVYYDKSLQAAMAVAGNEVVFEF